MLPPGQQSRGKLVVGGLMLASLALMLIFLQQQFDQGDEKRAIELLASKPPGASWSVLQELVVRAGTGSPDCQPKLLSSFQGTLEVTCFVGDGPAYRFHADLVRKAITPLDDRTRELVATAQAKAAQSSPADAG